MDDKENMKDLRLTMIKLGLEAEMTGMRLTNKAPPCFTIIASEFGIKKPKDKRARYEAFCAKFGFASKPAPEWHVIVNSEGTVLACYGSALREEAETSLAKIAEVGPAKLTTIKADKRPSVGQVIAA